MLDERLRVPVPLEDDALGLIVVEVDLVSQRAGVLRPHDLHGLSGQALELLALALVKLESSDTLKLTHRSGLQTLALLAGIDALGWRAMRRIAHSCSILPAGTLPRIFVPAVGAPVDLVHDRPRFVVEVGPSAALEYAALVLVRPAGSLHHSVDGDLRGGCQLHGRGSLLVGLVVVRSQQRYPNIPVVVSARSREVVEGGSHRHRRRVRTGGRTDQHGTITINFTDQGLVVASER